MAATKKAMKPKPESYRFSDEVKRLLAKLTTFLHSSKTYAVETAIREAAEKRGLK